MPSSGCRWVWVGMGIAMLWGQAAGQDGNAPPGDAPVRHVYVPYEKLKDVLGKEPKGVFLPYDRFRRLWSAAKGAPADAGDAPSPYLISTARFSGQVDGELARLRLELTVDILREGWVDIPLSLSGVGVVGAQFVGTDEDRPEAKPLLRFVDGAYHLLARGRGRRTVRVDFVRMLRTTPGRNLLVLDLPPAAVNTLELTIPDVDQKVDVAPMLAASTSATTLDGNAATRLQAFLGGAESVRLSWSPRARTGRELPPAILCTQLQHIHVGEAVLTRDVTFRYDIQRRGVDSLTVQLPAGFRVTRVDGEGIRATDLQAPPGQDVQLLHVQLFGEVKGEYALRVGLERFCRESSVELPLAPVLTREVLRRSGWIALTHDALRSVEVRHANEELVRVGVARLPKPLASLPGAAAYRFSSATYAATLGIDTVEPRISARQWWHLHVGTDRLGLSGTTRFTVERAGVFSLDMRLPEPWTVADVGPGELIDEHEVVGEGDARRLRVTLRTQRTGTFDLTVALRADRAARDAPVELTVPVPDPDRLHRASGTIVVDADPALRVEIAKLSRLQSIPISRLPEPPSAEGNAWSSQAANSAPPDRQAIEPQSASPPVEGMALAYLGIDATRPDPPAATFQVAVRPPRVSAQIHRLVEVGTGGVDHETVIDLDVRYAPVETFHLSVPADVDPDQLRISGPECKETARLDAPPEGLDPPAERPDWLGERAWYRVSLQMPRLGLVRLVVRYRREADIEVAGDRARLVVRPVYPVGVADARTYLAVATAPALALGAADVQRLTPADPTSGEDLPHEPHRRRAKLAMTAPGGAFALSVPVSVQEQAEVFRLVVNVAFHEQALGSDGTLNGRSAFALSAGRADRIAIELPDGLTPYAFLLDGMEIATEADAPTRRIVRLPHSSGEVSRMLLEVTYGSEGAPATLPTISLGDEVPVQMTLWRLWVPPDQSLLGYDDNFAPATAHPQSALSAALNRPAQLSSFPGSGVGHLLQRPGGASTLRVYLLPRQALVIGTWGAVVLGGVILLRFSWFARVMVILTGGLIFAVARLIAPLGASRIFRAGDDAVWFVLLLWVVHSLLVRWPRWSACRKAAREARGVATVPAAAPAGEGSPPPPTPRDPHNESNPPSTSSGREGQ